ncbi:MAG: hypothetical protein LBI42_06080 [Chitinispirillales bacterium]|jgi:hypothetical protein|nr:hypothetical protein [Chitinispirillales bacterium]
MFRALVSGVSVFALILMVGCGGGVNDQMLDEAQATIDGLKSKGLPDDKISSARVHLYQTREHRGKGNGKLAKTSADSMKHHLALAQKFYDEQVSTLGPTIESAKSQAIKAKEELTGYQIRKIDSTIAVVDSLKKMDWLLQSNNVAQNLITLLPNLKEDEVKSKNLRRLVPGEWVTETRTRSEEVREVNAMERKIFTFYRDGKVYLVESKKGQSGPFLREDWEFRSWGTYDFKGDTVMLSINRFAAVRQDFERKHREGHWVKEPQPRYDSTITDGSQDRFVTYDDLKSDFRQVKRF